MLFPLGFVWGGISIGVGWLGSRIYSDIRVMLGMGHYERVYTIELRAVG